MDTGAADDLNVHTVFLYAGLMAQSWAVVAEAPQQVSFRLIPRREIGPDEVLVQLEHSWISNGTEGSYLRGERVGGDTPWRPGDPAPFPHVPGYQSVGIVLEVGSQVPGLKPGNRVAATSARVDGMFHGWAGHVSPAIHHWADVLTLPEGLEPIAASGLVLVQVGFNVGTRPVMEPGDRAIVIGDGMVGHWSAQTLRSRGAVVALIGRHESRISRDVPQSGDIHLLTSQPDWKERLSEWAGSDVQVVAHTAGPIQPMIEMFPLLRRGAQLVSAGFVGTDGWVDVQALRDRELSLHAVSGMNRSRLEKTLALLAKGKLSTLPLISHHFPAQQAAEAFRLVLGPSATHLGVILDWSGVPADGSELS